MLEQFRFVRMTPDSIIGSFDCGDDDLNDFISNDARPYQEELLSVTYLFEDEQRNVAAFFSVANDSLRDDDFEKWNNLSRKLPNRKRRREYPAVKIGRLGVSKDFRGLGSEILFFIKSWFTTENRTGCRFLLVDAYNRPEVTGFYIKNDFSFLTVKNVSKRTRLMYFDLRRMIPQTDD